jgi:dihydroorotate dehydrogenase electron transfer subunit
VSAAAPVQAAARVLSNTRLTEEMLKLTLNLPAGWGPPRPGQFVQLACPPRETTGLRRPYCLAGYRATAAGVEIDIVYGVVGSRSRCLARCAPGEVIDLIGPLGRPFSPFPGRAPVLVGGGRGIAPLLMLAEEWKADHPHGALIYGTRTSSQLIPLKEPAYSVHVATDDGTAGFAGTVVQLLEELRKRGEVRAGEHALFACGPNAMLAAISDWARSGGLPCQVSLETYFGCGFGICAGCAVPMRPHHGVEPDPFHRYLLACQQGPVMDGLLVDWEGLHE